MLSPADGLKIAAQLELIETELAHIGARMKVLSADLERIREKLL
jgi:hypothetical protein